MKRPGRASRICARTPSDRGAAPLETATRLDRSQRSGSARIASATGRPIASPRKVMRVHAGLLHQVEDLLGGEVRLVVERDGRAGDVGVAEDPLAAAVHHRAAGEHHHRRLDGRGLLGQLLDRLDRRAEPRRVEGGHDQVLVAPDDALRVARGAAGVEDVQVVGGAAAEPVGRRRRPARRRTPRRGRARASASGRRASRPRRRARARRSRPRSRRCRRGRSARRGGTCS